MKNISADMQKKKVAIVGTQGVPAGYGGFETLVENIIGENCSDNIQYTVFCSKKDMPDRIKEYKGATLKYVPFHANGMQSIPYDIISMMRCLWKYDTILILGVSGCLFLPVFKLLNRSKVIVNIDGLEHRREKWKKWIRKYLRFSEYLAVRFADTIIADNKGIQDYVAEEYGKKAKLVTYGGDHVMTGVDEKLQNEILAKYSLEKEQYSMSVCRIEPENNCHITLEAFSKSKERLVFIGNWNRSEYSRALKEKYSKFGNITILDSIYDLDVLYTFRKHAKYYIHGHSAGGTNPSLVEAMFFARPIMAYDVVYNKETTFHKANYFKNAEELGQLLQKEQSGGEEIRRIAVENYTWQKIAKEYESLY